MNFYDELKPYSATIVLDKEEIKVERARLAKHYILRHLASSDKPEDVLRYVAVATDMPLDLVSELPFDEILDSYVKLIDLNKLHGFFPFHTKKRGQDKLDYEGRELASIVHSLASAYGWTRDEIFSLVPEEAFFYLLEIRVEDHSEKEYLYNISDVGYDKKHKKKKFPSLPYVWPRDISEKYPLLNITKAEAEKRGIIPSGKIIKPGGSNV